MAMRDHMAGVGVALLVSAVANGSPHTAAAIMHGMLTLGHTYPWVLARCVEEEGSETLLQLAQASCCPVTLHFVLDVGRRQGLPWPLPSAPPDDEVIADGVTLPPTSITATGGVHLSVETLPAAAVQCCLAADMRQVSTALGSSEDAPESGPATERCLPELSLAEPPECVLEMTLGNHAATTHSATLSVMGAHVALDRKGVAAVYDERQSPPLTNATQHPAPPRTVDTTDAPRGSSPAARQGHQTRSPTHDEQCPSPLGQRLSTDPLLPKPGASPSGTAPLGLVAAAPFPMEAYRAWLGQHNMLHQSQFFTFMTVVILVTDVRLAWQGHFLETWPTLVLFPFHGIRVVGAWRHPGWFAQHSEATNVVWHCIWTVAKVATVFFDAPFLGRPPLPYLMLSDWLIEGTLPTFYAQVGAMGGFEV